MKERYTSRWSCLRFGEPTLWVEQTCELGSRVVLLGVVDVVRSAANRHIKRCCHPSYIAETGYWGNKRSQPRLSYHGKS